jgi:hypothetical protein
VLVLPPKLFEFVTTKPMNRPAKSSLITKSSLPAFGMSTQLEGKALAGFGTALEHDIHS